MANPCNHYTYTDKNGKEITFKSKEELAKALYDGLLDSAVSSGDIKSKEASKIVGKTSTSSLLSSRKRAISNVSKGRVDNSQYTIKTLGDFLSINPKYIPQELKSKYNDQLEKISGKKVDISDKNKFLQDVSLLTQEINKSLVIPEVKEAKVRVDKTESYKQSISDSIDSLNSEDSYVSETFLSKDAKQHADFVRDTFNQGSKNASGAELKQRWLDSLSKEQLSAYSDVLSKLDKSGISDARLVDVRNSVDVIKRESELKPAIEKAKELTDLAIMERTKAGIAKIFGSSSELSKSALYHQARSYQKYTIDSIVGNVIDSPIYKNIFGKMSMQIGAHETYKSKEEFKVLNPIEKAQNDAYKNNVNDIIKSNIRQTLYTVQRMHILGGNQKINRPISEYVNNALDRNSKGYSEDTKKAIKDEYDNFVKIAGENGENIDAYFKSLNEADRKMIQSLDNFYSGDISTKAEATSYFDEKRALDLKNKGIYRPVDFFSNAKTMNSVQNSISGNAELFLNPSMKAGNLKEKTGATGTNDSVLNFTQPMNTANSYLTDVSLQYHVLNESRVVSSLIDKLKSDPTLSDSNNTLVQILEGINVNSMDSYINREYSDFGFLDKIKAGTTKAVLAGAEKATAELVSNVVNSATHVKDIANGLDIIGELKDSEVDFNEIAYNLKLPQGPRVLSKSHSKGSADIPFDKRLTARKDVIGIDVLNKLYEIYKRSGTKYAKQVIEDLHAALIETPDAVIAKPLILGMFDKAFTKLNDGVKPDYKKIAENDVEYMDKHKNIIEDAVMDADIAVSGIISSKNPMTTADKFLSSSKDSAIKKAYTKAQSFFSSHMNAQASGLYLAAKSALNNGVITKGEFATIFAQKVASQAAYTIVNNKLKGIIFTLITAPLFGLEENEDEDKGYWSRTLLGATYNLAFGKAGAISRGLYNFAGSMAESEYGEDLGLREGDYNPSKSAIQSSYNPNKTAKENIGRLATGWTGQYGLALNEGVEAFDNASDGNYIMAGMNAFSPFHFIPLYKDIKAQYKMAKYQGVPNLEEQEKIIQSKNPSSIDRMDLQKKLFLEDLAEKYVRNEKKLESGEISEDEFRESGEKIVSNLNNVFEGVASDWRKARDEQRYVQTIKEKIKSGEIPSFYKEFKDKTSTERALWVSEILDKYDGQKIPESVLKEIAIYQKLGLIKNKEIEKIKIYKSKY